MIRFEPSRKRTSPVVLSVPHSGLEIPVERGDLRALPENVFLRDVDFEVPRLWAEAAYELDIPFVVARTHRYAIDLNRRDDEIDVRSVEGHPAPAGTHPRGLFWIESTQGEPVLSRPLSQRSYRMLVDFVWKPYRDLLRVELEETRRKFGFAILIDGHSMPSQGTGYHADPNQVRADIVPGDALGKSCDPRITAMAVATAEAAGLSIKPNDPYKGGNITQSFGRPADRIHALQIEMNRGIYMDEGAFILNPDGVKHLQNFAKSFLTQVTRFKP